MSEGGEVMFVKQSYLDFRQTQDGDSKIAFRSKLLGMVRGSDVNRHHFSTGALDKIDKQMRDAAVELGATHVFGVTYQARDVGGTMGYGDAHKIEGSEFQVG